MMRFSQRYGYTPAQKAIQRESADEPLRIILWNHLNQRVWRLWQRDDRLANFQGRSGLNNRTVESAIESTWTILLEQSVDELEKSSYQENRPIGYKQLHQVFMSCAWHTMYDMLEHIVMASRNLEDPELLQSFNEVLAKAGSAYRFIGEVLAEVADANEIETIDDALNSASDPVRAHLDTALHMLSDRTAPDYRNSIKESISAVEAACRLTTGNAKATLGQALKKVSNLHPAMQGGFSSLYGYTCDASGVRHALLEEATITFADAKFMLVACSAFVNYLKLSAPP